MNKYFRSKENEGWAAWPLFSPANPRYGQWSWIAITGNRVKFVRPMTDAEVSRICDEFTIWGMMIVGEPWALVQGRPGGNGISSYSTSTDISRSVGV